MNKYLLVGVVAILAIAGGWWYLIQSSSVAVSETNQQPTTQQNSNVVEQPRQQDTDVSTQTNPTPTQQALSISNGAIKITSPNGGETFKLGNTVRVTWNAQNVPSGSQLELELFQITGDRPVINAQGACTNCVESGLRSGVPFVSVANGSGSAEWVVGKQYSGEYVAPGSHYIMKATVSKSGSVDAGECPSGSFKGTCEIFYQIDWSDGTFSLTN